MLSDGGFVMIFLIILVLILLIQYIQQLTWESSAGKACNISLSYNFLSMKSTILYKNTFELKKKLQGNTVLQYSTLLGEWTCKCT